MNQQQLAQARTRAHNRRAAGKPGLVDPAAACPICHENRTDSLVWNDDEEIVCATCSYTYDPTPTPYATATAYADQCEKEAIETDNALDEARAARRAARRALDAAQAEFDRAEDAEAEAEENYEEAGEAYEKAEDDAETAAAAYANAARAAGQEPTDLRPQHKHHATTTAPTTPNA